MQHKHTHTHTTTQNQCTSKLPVANTTKHNRADSPFSTAGFGETEKKLNVRDREAMRRDKKTNQKNTKSTNAMEKKKKKKKDKLLPR